MAPLTDFLNNPESNAESTNSSPTPRELTDQEFIKQADEHTPPFIDENYFPDIEGFGWDLEETKPPALIRPLWRKDAKFYDDNVNHEKISGNAGLILKGASEYLETHGLTCIDYPHYYSRMDEFEPTFRWSADGRTHISQWDINGAVRLANGSGHIDTKTTKIALCAPGTLVVQGPRGIFLTEISSNSHSNELLPDPPANVHHSVQGISIPEENPKYRTGFKRLFNILEKSNRSSIAEYDHFEPDKHHYQTVVGEIHAVSRNGLACLRTFTDDSDDIVTTHQTTCKGDEYSVTVPEEAAPKQIGEQVTITPQNGWEQESISGIIAGYRSKWTGQDYMHPGSHGVAKLRFTVNALLISADGSITQESTFEEEVDV